MTKRVAIIGAGITGLVTAYELQKLGVDVTVYETTDRAGGPLHSIRRDGFLAERGPHTIMQSNAVVGRLIDELGLVDERIEASSVARKRFMVRDGKPRALPTSPAALLSGKAFSPGVLLALLREPFVPRRDDGVDESVTNFVTRRLNRELLEYGLELLVNGVWAGDPNRLSARYAFRKMYALERDYGSLVRGGIRKARGGGSVRSPIISFRDGNQVFSDALADAIDDLRLGRAVRTIRRADGEWTVHNGSYDDVVVTVGAPALLEMTLTDDDRPIDVKFLADVAYPCVTIVTCGFRASDVPHPLDGFGMIAPKREQLDILGVLFTSSLFEHRAPDGHVTLATFVGGMRRRDLWDIDDDARLDLVRRELGKTLGVRGAPVFVEQARWGRAIPQYEVGYGRILARAAAAERKHPGLHIAGNLTQGVAVPDLIEAGAQLAHRIATSAR